MRIAKTIFLAVVMCILCSAYAGAQPDDMLATGAPADVLAASQEAQTAVSEPKDTIIYGEVQRVDAAGATMTVLYYDYDSDEERTIDLAVSDSAAIENAADLAGIVKGDWADITFLSQDKGNVVSSIIVEREEEPAEMMPEDEATE